MRVMCTVALLFAGFSATVAKPNSSPYLCGLKSTAPDIAWNKVKPLWYMAAHTPDEVFSKVVGCQIIEYFSSDGDVYELHLKNYYRNTSLSPENFMDKADVHSPYTIYIDPVGSAKANSKVGPEESNEEAVVENLSFDGAKLIALTDYDTYITFFICIPDGTLLSLVFTSTPDPSTEKILEIRDILIKANGLTILEKTDCSTTNFEPEDIRKNK